MFEDLIKKKPDDLIIKIFNRAGGWCIVNNTRKRITWSGKVYQSEIDEFKEWLESIGIHDIVNWQYNIKKDYELKGL